MRRICDGEADVGHGKSGQVARAKGQVLCGPYTEDYTSRPRACGRWGHTADGSGDSTHHIFLIIVELSSVSEICDT